MTQDSFLFGAESCDIIVQDAAKAQNISTFVTCIRLLRPRGVHKSCNVAWRYDSHDYLTVDKMCERVTNARSDPAPSDGNEVAPGFNFCHNDQAQLTDMEQSTVHIAPATQLLIGLWLY